MTKYISLRGVRTNNLKNINVDVPRNKVTVITGISGSGKSSLAFDTIYAQAQNEYLESISTYVRRDLGKIKKPKVRKITGLSPTIAIEQKKLSNNPRSTVGTYTEIYTFLRLLFSRCSRPAKPILYASSFSFNNPKGTCPRCKGLGFILDVNINKIIDFDKSIIEGAIDHPSFRLDGYKMKILKASRLFDLNKPIKQFSKKELDALLYSKPIKVAVPEYVAKGFSYSTFEGIVTLTKRLLKRSTDKKTERGQDLMSFNKKRLTKKICPSCKSMLLKKESLRKKINGLNISEAANLPLNKLMKWNKQIKHPLADNIKREISKRCKRLIDLGLEYLHLNRPIPTLSGGESQRVKLAKHLGLNLIEMIYILDEPTIGMHPVEILKMIRIIKKLKEKGNTVIVVEHEPQVMRNADFLIDLGPKAGRNGGKIVACGEYKEFIKNKKSITAQILSGKSKFEGTSKNRPVSNYFFLTNLCLNNLRSIDVKLAKNVLNLIVGASGAGKSSLVEEFINIYPDSILIDQSPIGSSPRSNPATYTGLFDLIRKEFAKVAGCSSQLLSFNSKGRCEKCKGLGMIKINMHFMADIEIECDECKGKRYNKEALKLMCNKRTMNDILKMSVIEALQFFKSPSALGKLQLLSDVGLGYIKLGQSSLHLSGGESQRVKLAKFLSENENVLILDEPTVGLHPYDIDKLMSLMHKIVDKGNTVIIVEHNTDVIKNADWIIELGPKGGDQGGKVIFEGTPEGIVSSKRSIMKAYLWKI